MTTYEMLIDFGAELSTAEVVSAKFDRGGYGEVALQGKRGSSFLFSVSCEQEINLLSCELFNHEYFEEEIDEMNDEIEWDDILCGGLAEKIIGRWQDGANGPYYDFCLDEYETEDENG